MTDKPIDLVMFALLAVAILSGLALVNSFTGLRDPGMGAGVAGVLLVASVVGLLAVGKMRKDG